MKETKKKAIIYGTDNTPKTLGEILKTALNLKPIICDSCGQLKNDKEVHHDKPSNSSKSY